MTSSDNNNPYKAFFDSQKDPLAGLAKPVTMDHSFASQKSLVTMDHILMSQKSPFADLLEPKTLHERVESLKQGNPRDGIYQVVGQHSGALGEIVVTGGIDPVTGEPACSLAHGSDKLKVKYRETPNHSALFVEHKAKTPFGTAYCERGGTYSNGVIGFFISLVLR
jgi:hypothetical protein